MEREEQFLRDIPLLARLSPEDIRALARGGRQRAYLPGTVIVREGSPGDSLQVILQGRVRVTRLSPLGEEATLAVISAGDCFGDLALLDGRPRSANVLAMEPTKTFVVTREAFHQWLSERPAAALALLETLSLRIRRVDQSLADRFFLDASQRLAKLLLERLEALPEGEKKLRVTQAELASSLGVTRESVNKQLAVLAREGWVRTGRGSVTVLEPERLASSLGPRTEA